MVNFIQLQAVEIVMKTKSAVVASCRTQGARVSRVLRERGFVVVETEGSTDTLRECYQRLPTVIVVDLQLRGSCDGCSLAKLIREYCDFNPPRIVLTGHATGYLADVASQLEVAFIGDDFVEAEVLRALGLPCLELVQAEGPALSITHGAQLRRTQPRLQAETVTGIHDQKSRA